MKEIIKDIKRLNQLETKPTEIKFLKFNEEYGELSAEYLKLLGYTYKDGNLDDLKSEMADTLQCLLSIYLDIEEKYGIKLDDVFQEIMKKNIKWENKIKEYNINP